MKVSTEKLPESQVILNIEVEPPEVEQSLQKAYRRLVSRVNIPGFRRGKAPRAMLERYLGKATLLEEALEDLIPEVCGKAIAEQSLEAIAQPRIEVLGLEPVTIKATVPLKPRVDLGDYRNLRLQPEPVAVSPAEVQAALEELRAQQTPWEPADRPGQFGDLVTLDIEATVDGQPFTNQQGVQYQVVSGRLTPVPGFAEKLVGMEKNQTQEFSLSFPAEHESQELAGKAFAFRVKVSEVKAQRLPELNDEFAKSVGPGYPSLEALQEHLADRLRSRAEVAARRRFEEKVLAKVIEGAKLEFPPLLVEREVDRLLGEEAQRLREKRTSLEEYLANLKKTEADLRAELTPQARQRVGRSLVVSQVVEEAGIKVEAEEVEKEIETLVKAAGGRVEEMRRAFRAAEARRSLERGLLSRQALERLAQIAEGQATAAETQPPPASQEPKT